ncbi:response regulator [Sporosarcina sp. P37]|uniref:ANTAR domain-containing response regulator n=1 Tax=unclassified Sporosarcina TaxID=2647733 RepID=UPI0009C02AEB|nr:MULTISPECIES: response regulator [unclassified Sporosarcina]ARD48264.1 Fis family transcriptional regulator [Sporosarcina sp. P33]ARK24778.1 response regulator [Sporosarcina sp. P37]PID19937.1 response regulator [Sporosarcina sp. P35]
MSKRILIAEDESIIRMDLKMTLLDHGYEVVGEAGDGDRAIELAFLHKPDLVLMDIKMPKMNGLKASRIIGEQLDIPILIITAYSQKEFVEKAQQDNVVGYLVKPISESNLIPAIEVALHQSGKAKRLKESVQQAKQEVEKRKVIERAKGILMDAEHLTEQQAFKQMRDMSMSRQMTMVSVAMEIIDSHK